jgi:hypothetical protein
MQRTHNLLSLAMYNKDISVLQLLLARMPFHLLQQDLSTNIVDVVYGAFFHRPTALPKLHLLLQKKEPSFDFTCCKGRMLHTFIVFVGDDLISRTSPFGQMTHSLLRLPGVFSSEYAYDYIIANQEQNFEALLHTLVHTYHMCNLPQLYLLLLNAGLDSMAELIRLQPRFAFEIVSVSDTYKQRIVLFTTQFPIVQHIEAWFVRMRIEWRWTLTHLRFLAIADMPTDWKRVAFTYGIKRSAGSPDTCEVYRAFQLLRTAMRKRHRRVKHTRRFQWVLFDLLCRPTLKSSLYLHALEGGMTIPVYAKYQAVVPSAGT